uniref:FH1/FH2 domain-containing protein 3 n=1 Tax=Cacopsylla melanoneura TaxID=428564 RepID=A0A8D8VVZ3_9HEMI
MLDTDDLLSFRVQYVNDCDPFSVYQSPEPTVPQLYKFSSSIPLVHQISALHRYLRAPHKLDDATIQLYKDGDFGSYLDLEQSIAEQSEDFEGFGNNRHNSIILRTQLSVRVHNILEKLYSSEGKDLRRALFSLKQIFQADKDLVHEFVQNDGLTCLVKVGTEADQNHQNYILRALGQVMLYVDGMTGIMEHPPTVQWLYCLVASKFRLVIKTALKLLLIFVEYVESNCFLLIQAVHAVDNSNGEPPWSNIMRLLTDRDSTDTELLRYAMSLLNKTLNGIPDQDSYYDQVDALEEQGIAIVIRRYMSKQGTDLDLLRQFQIYEAVLLHEDGEDKGTPLRQLDEAIRKTLRNRKSLTPALNNNVERRKSRRFSTNSQPTLYTPITNIYHHNNNNHIIQDSPSDDTGLKNKRECSVKDLTQKLSNLHSPSDKLNTNNSMVGEMKGIISKAKEGLAKSQSRGELKSPTVDSPGPKMPEIKKSETDLHWEELLKSTTKVLVLCDLDFSDLHSDEDRDILAPTHVANGVPPPPPPCGVPPPQPMGMGAPPPVPNMVGGNTLTGNKTKKTVKLFWKEVREDPIVISKLKSSLIWDELSPVKVDTQKLEHLFESRAKDLISKKQHELNKHKEVIVLDPKRSNAINIAMTKLPPPRSIRTAILKMDSTVVNREGIEKLLSMLPTDEEKCKILEAVSANPGVPLGSAENFLLELSNINELVARLKLWAFKLDYDNLEREVAEPLMDLKQGMDILQRNPTFKAILSTLLSIGIFLNGTEVKGFQIDYLTKVPEVKDTVHKHSLLHHLCDLVLHQFPQSTDLYSEIGPVTRASKVDFDELASSLHRMETECKASFDHLKLIIKHDGSATQVKVKMSEFLSDTAQRIIILGIVHRRVLHRFHRFSLWLGIPLHRAPLTKPQDLMRIISEFALEYRTTRERVIQTREKKANHRERNKTRGKMITEVSKMRSQEDRADAELRQLLEPENTDPATQLNGTLTWRPRRKESVFNQSLNGTLGDGQEDELLESLVKTATKIPAPRTVPRERKRTRHADRKSLVKRSRTRDNMPENNNVYLSESAS